MPLNPLAFDTPEEFQKALLENGRKQGWTLLPDARDFVEHTLEHHGVKGMKWGVRRNRSSSVTITDKRKKIKTSGGHGRPAHPDAVRVRKIGQVGKASGLKALSDDELKAYTARLNLEQNAKRLQFEDSSVGRKAVLTILRQTGKQSTQEVSTAASGAIKKALVAAAA